jgi:hypothetical protein
LKRRAHNFFQQFHDETMVRTAAPTSLRKRVALQLFVYLVFLPLIGSLSAAEINFDQQIAPLFASKCLDCHNSREPKGHLDLSTKKNAYSGGDSGIILTAGKIDESYLWDRVANNEMPPKHPLSVDEKQILKQWIAEGAKWGTDPIDPFAFTTDSRAGYDWWALQSLQRQQAPPVKGHPIDAFVHERMKSHGITQSSPADKRTLIRRLSFDLIGLPPTPDEVKAFVNDNSPDAYEKLINRLLASPHYGERWARHWLDLARFGESQGFERDKLRDNAWPYRDWVINALNGDMPYDQFARLQLAGDVLHPGDADAITATGFLVAGAYDEVGQSQQSAAMRAVVRQDELEDYIGTVGQTFLGLTINCARCHDHKFDPITQVEYYRLASALSGIRHGERPLKTKEMQQQIQVAQQELKQIRSSISGLLDPVREQILSERKSAVKLKNLPKPISRWTFENDFRDEVGTLHGTTHGGAKLDDGKLILNGTDAYVSTATLPVSLTAKTLEAWVQLDNLTQRGGGVISLQDSAGNLFDAIVFGEKTPGHWMAGSNSFARTKTFSGHPDQEAGKQLVHVAIVYDKEGNIHGYRNGVPYGKPYKSSGPITFSAGQSQIVFGLRHGTSAGGNRMLAGKIEQAQLYDRALSTEEIAQTAGLFNILTRPQLLAKLSDTQKQQLTKWEAAAVQFTEQIKSLSSRRVYAVTPRQPAVSHLLLRGNPGTPAEVVTPGGIASLQTVSAEFELSADAPEAERRKELAEWITSYKNPLFARVIVNRLWHYHFGRGLVTSPNDFGFNGARPTHPQLLDFLAQYLIDHNWSLKAVHKMIVTSDTYRQSSKPRPDMMKVDAGNQWFWRYSPQRLEAEVVRDAMLRVTGTLNPQLGGPSYRNFETFNRNSQFYVMKDKTGPEYHRRTIYRMWVRSGRNQLLDALDCPDPSTTTPDRAVTTTPTQSLSLLNNSFVLRMADELATRIENEQHPTTAANVSAAYLWVLQRKPKPKEMTLAVPFVEEHGLPALGRILFNTNEFLFAE